MENNKICYHNYADDTQSYITISPGDYSPIQTLSRSVERINDWMCQSFLQLNKDKTEIIVFGAKEEQLTVSAQFQSVMLKTTSQARNLSVIMDSDLDFSSHTKTITKSAYCNLKYISRTKGLMTQQDKNLSMHLSSADLTTATLSLQYSLKSLSNSCSWFRTLLLKSLQELKN